MNITVILLLSIIFQLAAAFLIIRLIWFTGKRVAWALIATAVFLMVVRRIVLLYHLLLGATLSSVDSLSELIGLFLSFFLAIGVALIAPIFDERRQIENALQKSEQKYRDLFEETYEGIYITSPEGKILDINKKGIETLGYDSKEEVLRLDLVRDVYANPADRERILDMVGKQGTYEYDVIVKQKSGREITTRCSLTGVKDEDGKIISYRGIIRDITEEVEKERLNNALNDINLIVNSTLNLDEIMRQVIDKASVAIGAEEGVINIREEEHWVTRYGFGHNKYTVGEVLSGEIALHVDLAAKAKKPLTVNELSNELELDPETMETMKRCGIRAVMAIPLFARDKTIGMMFLNYYSTAVTFTEAQRDFASKLSILVSLAIQNARLYEAEHSIADTLQEALLIAPEYIEGVDYGYLYRSAAEAAKVGGDFFDIFELEHGRVGIMVGDVSGKGLQAASITSLVKNTVRAYAYEEVSPATILMKANNTVKKSMPASHFITLFLGILDVNTGDIIYCSAGHPPAILKKKDKAELLSNFSPILGAFSNASYVESVINIQPGDVLVLYTDGITEARHCGEFFGEERLVSYVNNLKMTSANDAIKAIFNEVMSFTSGKLFDDALLLSVGMDASAH